MTHALVLEPRELFDPAICGQVNLPEGRSLVVYDWQRLIEVVMEDHGCDRDDAIDFLEFNTLRACEMTAGAPLILFPYNEESFDD